MGTESINELHRLLGVLRSADEDGQEDDAGLRTRPGLAHIDALVRDASQAGMPATLTVSGTAADVDSSIGLTVFRVVQEGLTNAAKHGRGSRTDVSLAWAREGLTIRVRNEIPNKPLRVSGRVRAGWG